MDIFRCWWELLCIIYETIVRMTTIYTGSNYGIISTLNTGSGSILTSTSLAKSWELVKNYTSGSILIELTAATSGGWIDFQIEYSNDGVGTVSSIETHRFLQARDTTATLPLYPPTPIVLQFKPQGAYMRVVLNNLSPITIAYNIQTRYNNSADPDTADGAISSANSFNLTSVGTSVTLNGAYEDISEYSLITILTIGTSASVPGDCTLQCIFSTDGTNVDRTVSYTIQDITANGGIAATNSLTFNPAHTLLPISRYFKIVFINNNSVALSTLRITTTYHTTKSKGLTSRNTQGLTDQFDSDTVRAILTGRTIGTLLPQGHYQNIGVQNQAIATYVREPSTAFGEILTGQLTPQIQFDYSNGEPYEVQAPIFRNITAQTSYTYSNGLLNISSTAAVGGTNTIINVTSSEYTKYKPGLGLDSRFTVVFNSNNGAGINQYAGLFTPENSLTFGYFDTNGFCIRHGRGGLQQIVDINITAGTSTGTQITINVGGTAVTTTGLTAGNTIVQAAYAISNAINATFDLNTYGWKAIYFKATSAATTYTVRMVRSYASTTNVTVTVITAGGYTITPTTVRNGLDTTYIYYPQTTWNIDTCLGLSIGTLQTRYNTNPSGFQLDPTKGNVYRVVFQYLGFGVLTFYIENHETGVFMPIHQIKYANTATVPSVTSPNYKLGFAIENASTTPITMSGGSIAAFIQGAALPAPLYRSYPNIITANTGGALTISKENSRVIFGFRILDTKSSPNSTGTTLTINRSNLFLNSISVALNIAVTNTNTTTSANLVFQLVKNPTSFYLGDPPTTIYAPDWTLYERDSTIQAFNGTARTSTTTGIGYTGGVNVTDIPLVENTANVINLQPLLINVSANDIYIVSYYGNTTANVTTFDVMASISYQINN
jgi:hypothetical protein